MPDEGAKQQLLRRFCLIDAIAVYAFRAQIYFKGIVFVPSIPRGSKIEERVPLPWKTTDEKTIESDDTIRSWASEDVRSLVPDINSCVIRVAVAPNYFSQG